MRRKKDEAKNVPPFARNRIAKGRPPRKVLSLKGDPPAQLWVGLFLGRRCAGRVLLVSVLLELDTDSG